MFSSVFSHLSAFCSSGNLSQFYAVFWCQNTCVFISKTVKKQNFNIAIYCQQLTTIQITFTFLFLIYSKFMLKQKNTPDESIWHCSFAHAGKLTLAQNDSWLITFSVLTSCSSCNSTRARSWQFQNFAYLITKQSIGPVSRPFSNHFFPPCLKWKASWHMSLSNSGQFLL